MRRPRIFISLGERTRPLLRALLLELFFTQMKKSGSSLRNSIKSAFQIKRKTYRNFKAAPWEFKPSVRQSVGFAEGKEISFFSITNEVRFLYSCKESSKETRKGGEECVPPARTFSPSFEPPSLIASKSISFDKHSPRMTPVCPAPFKRAGRSISFRLPCCALHSFHNAN